MPGGDIYGTHIKVPDSLEGAGTFINGISRDTIDDLTRLENKLLPLAETWVGDTYIYFEDQRRAWNVAADGLFGPEGIMGMIAHALNVNYQNYSEAELTNTATWKH
ncbi:WXG100 family type VII secretion target [Catenuloplanes sp. NPDC051500]|uniref:WXG100 family type VII secretion target n=1 Tax=Catenuloplanes sp. NPDC051500 TaxID=3363959 RepID=UPI000AC6D093